MNTPHVAPMAVNSTPKPAASAPPRSPAQPKPDEGGGLRIFTYLRLHWLMILFCGTLLGGGGAYAAWELLASKYESYGLLQVSSVQATVANQGNPNQGRADFVTYLKTTSALIKSELVLNAALRDMKDLMTIKAQKDPLKYLEEELLVSWQDGSEVIRITFKSHEPADAKKIVDAVLKAFEKEVVQEDAKQRKAFQDKVQESMVDLRKLLNQRAETKSGLAKGPDAGAPGGVPGAMPPVTPAGGVPVPPPALPAVPEMSLADRLTLIDPKILVNKITGLIAEAERIPLVINDGKRRLVVLQQKMDGVKTAPVSQTTLDAIEKDGEVFQQTLITNRAKRDYEFAKNSSSDENSTGVVRLKNAWDGQQAKLAQMRKDKAETIESTKRIAEAQKIAGEMEELIRSLQKQQEQLLTVQKLLADAEKQLAALPLPDRNGVKTAGGTSNEPPPYRPDGSELDMQDGVYRRLVQQFLLTQMELHSPPRVRVYQWGSTPTQKEMKKQIMGTVFAALMGFGIMALGVVAFESSAKRVSSLADVKAATPTPIVGVIPCTPADAMGKDAAKRTTANEAIDKLRAYVAQTWLARGATTIAVTSPIEEEGKAFTAFGLASSLSQSGYKTLLVDFDLRAPQLHEMAGVPNDVGVCELLRAESDARSAVQFLASGLHLLPAGKWSDEARKAATGEKLEALLAKLRGPYDCVVLHGHALLTAAEAVEVARRCEVVLVCALYRTTTTPLLKRAAERVATMEIPYSGVVYVGATEQEALC